MKMICVKNQQSDLENSIFGRYDKSLVIGELYECEPVANNIIWVKFKDGQLGCFPIEYFKTITEIRNERINKILE